MPKKANKPQEQKPPNEMDLLRRMLATPPQPRKGKDKEAKPEK